MKLHGNLLRKTAITLTSLFLCYSSEARTLPGRHAQPFDDLNQYMVIGINGFRNLALQVGYQWHFSNFKGEGKEEKVFALTVHAAMDVQVLPRFGLAPNISVRCSQGNSYSGAIFPMLGIDYLFYTDFNGTNQVLRPIAGIEANFGGTLSYGYNFQIDTRPFILPTRHTIQVTVPLWVPFIMILE